ncbi:hypothetical protein [Chitinimonas koreensis]|uniref:hypothetical protein n=1 Tax=Chitinimonas koreensis TaxID=356302 RepID=UPI00040B99EE|nr:hypothetical protein [Chitinimonas koreensis]QNM96639.1 hypothetical protein H9L41_23280 [Chitinimonas koreensis]
MTTPAPTPTFPSWTFDIPADVAKLGFQLAIYGQDPDSLGWLYWDATTGAYVAFADTDSGQDTTPLIDATPTQAGGYPDGASYAVTLAASQYIQSGVVAMFIGGSSGVPVSSGVPASPTTSTNPADLYSLFEFSYLPAAGSSTPTLDIDISNVDQLGFTYTVTSSSAPFPLTEVGSSVAQQTVFSRFATAFPAGHAFNECVVYGQENVGGTATQLRLLAPQDVLQAIMPPLAPSYLAPTGAPSSTEPFADSTYFYLVSETSPSGETAPNAGGLFGGFLLSSTGQPQAASIAIGWQSGGTPVAYVPTNPSATGLNLYRASGPAADAGTTPPSAPSDGYGLLASLSIADWNAQTGYVYLDSSTRIGSQAPKTSSYGFSALSTWFDQPLQAFFTHYATNTFALYQYNQGGGSGGTLWTGTVLDVVPQQGQAISSQQYIDETGTAQSIAATWQWGDGTQTYKVLQLVGNAYDPDDWASTDLKGQSGLSQGEYQGAVVNLYFPYFAGNTGLGSMTLPDGTIYTPPPAPDWLNNAVNGPSQMVFGCAGTFATPNAPDAIAQQAGGANAVLAANALTNLQNVIVSALNRGVATGYGFALGPQQYTCPIGFSAAPASAAQAGAIPTGSYTYHLSATLNDGSETALSWPQTIALTGPSTVVLSWLPQPAALYQQANVYRQAGTGTIELVGTVANTTTSQATGFTDANVAVTQPTNGAPYRFYPDWNDASGADYVPSNLFAAFLHQNLSADSTAGISLNGLVYGYPFDDQGSFSTNINYGTAIPSGITFQVTSLS